VGDLSDTDDTTDDTTDDDFVYSPNDDMNTLAVTPTITYNLETRNVPVDMDVLNASGGYTIQLENNAFFPYEVQFAVNGDTRTEWFITPDSVVNVGGYDFRVFSRTTDDSILTQIGFYVGDKYVAAYPTPKVFSHIDFGAFSLLPLEERAFTVDLTQLNPPITPPELSRVRFSAVFAGQQGFTNQSHVVWARYRYYYDSNSNLIGTPIYSDYNIARINDRINLSLSGTFEMIVGDANQLNPNNIRYAVTVNSYSYPSDWLGLTIASQNGNTRTPVATDGITTAYNYIEFADGYYGYINGFNVRVDESTLRRGTPGYLGLTWGSMFANHPARVRVFLGAYSTPEEAIANGTDITSQIWNRNMTQLNMGYPSQYFMGNAVNEPITSFTMVLGTDNDIAGYMPFFVTFNRFQTFVNLATVTDGTSGTTLASSSLFHQETVSGQKMPILADVSL